MLGSWIYVCCSQIAQCLWGEVGKVATEIIGGVERSLEGEMRSRGHEEGAAPVLCVCKHGGDADVATELSSLKSDVIRMLIRRSDYPHALCIHFCGAASNFHVYSSRVGWVSFSPAPHALIVTFGDQLQASNSFFF